MEIDKYPISLMNAIVPKPYLSNFFEFIYDIYKINFQYTLSHDLKQEFMFVYEGLAESVSDDTDNLNF